jgi:hypothetical protein
LRAPPKQKSRRHSRRRLKISIAWPSIRSHRRKAVFLLALMFVYGPNSDLWRIAPAAAERGGRKDRTSNSSPLIAGLFRFVLKRGRHAGAVSTDLPIIYFHVHFGTSATRKSPSEPAAASTALRP